MLLFIVNKIHSFIQFFVDIESILYLSKEKNYGYVLLGGHSVCNHGWNDKNAAVVCREIGVSGELTKAIATTTKVFGPVSFASIWTRCEGSEDKLTQCEIKNKCPGSIDAAGAICIDEGSLKLVGGNHTREGNVYISDAAVCHHKWDRNDAQVICRRLFDLPAFEATNASTFGDSQTTYFILDNVECEGNENLLTDCKYVTMDAIKCESNEVAGIRCAKCRGAKYFISVLSIIKEATRFTELEAKINEAEEKLKKDCYPWKCAYTESEADLYPEYCAVKRFLRTAMIAVKSDYWRGKQIRLKEDPKSSLEREILINISNAIHNVEDKVQDSRKVLGEYFQTMAEFDQEQSLADYKFHFRVWQAQVKKLNDETEHFKKEMSAMIQRALITQGLKLGEQKARAFLSYLALPSPKTLLEKVTKNIQLAIDTAVRMGKLTNGLKLLVWVRTEYYPRMIKLATLVRKNLEENKDVFKAVSALLNLNDENDIEKVTVEDCNSFLDKYEAYQPAFPSILIGEYKALLTLVVTKTCEIFTSGDLVATTGAHALALEKCPNLKVQIGTMVELIGHTKGIERTILVAAANFARAKVSAIASQELSKNIRTSSSDINEAINQMQARIFISVNKMKKIKVACDTAQYLNFGQERDFCIKLKKNSEDRESLEHLIDSLLKQDVLCEKSRVSTFRIPAAVRVDDEPIAPDVLDLTTLLDPTKEITTVWLNLTDKDWLVRNFWISEGDKGSGPFYVKKMQIHPLPILSEENDVEITTQASVARNWVGKDEYEYDKEVYNIFSYMENDHQCGERKISPYSFKNCPQMGKICHISNAEFGTTQFYPSLMSLWQIHFKIPIKHRKRLIFPKGPFYFQVSGQICYRQKLGQPSGWASLSSRSRSRSRTRSGSVSGSQPMGECCGADSSMFYNADQGKKRCEKCPDGSSSR